MSVGNHSELITLLQGRKDDFGNRSIEFLFNRLRSEERPNFYVDLAEDRYFPFLTAVTAAFTRGDFRQVVPLP